MEHQYIGGRPNYYHYCLYVYVYLITLQIATIIISNPVTPYKTEEALMYNIDRPYLSCHSPIIIMSKSRRT